MNKLALAAGLAACLAVSGANASSFGPNSTYTWISAAEFRPDSGAGCDLVYAGNYQYSFAGGCTIWSAPIELPEGALLIGYRMVYIDNSVSNLSFALDDIAGEAETYDETDFHTTSVQTTALQSDFFSTAAPYTIKHPSLGFYRLRVYTPAIATGMELRGARLFWERQISPAPVSATFNDVPTNHPFFREIQALSASSITQGCGGGAFCPDAAVTRGQMAAFLSRALGL